MKRLAVSVYYDRYEGKPIAIGRVNDAQITPIPIPVPSQNRERF